MKTKSKNIIFVNDNEKVTIIYKRIMRKFFHDYTFEIYTNPSEALERVTKNGFDLLITDYTFKDYSINGLDLSRMAWPLGKPILLLSCHKWIVKFKLTFRYRDMKDRITFLLKPISILTTIKKIKELLKTKNKKDTEEMFNIITNSMTSSKLNLQRMKK